jgi:hypothetical protein
LIIPDANGVNTSHKGNVELVRDGELKSDDGKSMVTVRAFENFGILLAVQYQVDSSNAKLYVFVRSQDKGYVMLVSGVSLLRNDGIKRAASVVHEVGDFCKYSVSQSFASMGDHFKQNPGSTLEKFLEAKREELKSSGSAQTCKKVDLGTNPDDQGGIVNGGGPAQGGGNPSQQNPPQKQEGGGPEQQRPSRPVIPAPPEDRPVSQQPEQRPLPPYPQYPPSEQKPAPVYQQPPVQQKPTTPVYQQPPVQQQQPTPVYQQDPPSKQVDPPVYQQDPRQVTDSKGYHTNWQACYAAGKWRTDGNLYCKQTWWTNCSPESGGKKCKVSGQETKQENKRESSDTSEERVQTRIGAWTQDFQICYAAGRWESSGNKYCKKDFWPNCSPETGGEKCRPVYQ